MLAEHSTCGPRAALALNSPYETGTDVYFVKTDFVAAAGNYTILIEAADGRQKTLTRPSSLTDGFMIPISEFYEDVDNFVRLQTEATCGVTGYGNAVSYHREAATGCLQTMTSYRTHLGDGDDLSHLHIATSAAGCPGGTLFNMYFEREGTTQPVSLNPIPAPITSVIIPNLPAGASHGRYWVAAFNPQTGAEFKSSPAVNDGLHSTGADTGSEPGEASRNLRFAHLDHLGSTRLLTDEAGEVVARLKFYPFGMEAETSGGNATRMKFTGHERDGDVHVDYMLARYYAAGLGRFLSVDPVIGNPDAPGSWNRIAYVRSSPLVLVDPDGRETFNWVNPKGPDDAVGHEARAVTEAILKTIWIEDVFGGDVNLYVHLQDGSTSQSDFTWIDGKLTHAHVYLDRNQWVEDWVHEFGAVLICVNSQPQCDRHERVHGADDPAEEAATSVGRQIAEEAGIDPDKPRPRAEHESEGDGGSPNDETPRANLAFSSGLDLLFVP